MIPTHFQDKDIRKREEEGGEKEVKRRWKEMVRHGFLLTYESQNIVRYEFGMDVGNLRRLGNTKTCNERRSDQYERKERKEGREGEGKKHAGEGKGEANESEEDEAEEEKTIIPRNTVQRLIIQ